MDKRSNEPSDADQQKKATRPQIRKLIWLPLAVALGLQYAIAAPTFSPSEDQTLSHRVQSNAAVTYEVTVSPHGQILQSTARTASDIASKQGGSLAANTFLEAATNTPYVQGLEAASAQNGEPTLTQQMQGAIGQRIVAAKVAHKKEVQERVEQLSAARVEKRTKSISKLRVNGATISTELAERIVSAEPDFASHIDYIDQNKMLPSGCEIIALTVALRSMGYDKAEPTDIADHYIEYGGNQKTQYTGSPYDNGGCLATCIVNAANKWFDNGVEKQGDNSLPQSTDDDDDDAKDQSDSKSAEKSENSSSASKSDDESDASKDSDSKSDGKDDSSKDSAPKNSGSSSSASASKVEAAKSDTGKATDASSSAAATSASAASQSSKSAESPSKSSPSKSSPSKEESNSAESKSAESASSDSAKPKDGASSSASSKSSSSASAKDGDETKSDKESSTGNDTKKEPALPIDDACAYDLTGTSYKDLCELVKLGYPVLVWTTEDMASPSIWSTWYHPEHCVVLYGFKDDDALVSDSLEGLVKRDSKRFGEIYESVGKHAVFICPKA